MNARTVHFSLALALGMLSLIGALVLLAAPAGAVFVAVAQDATRYVAYTGADGGDCTNPAAPCRTLQYAVDAATGGDEIWVATGVYTGVSNHGGLVQVVYLNKTLTLRGGYRADFGVWDPLVYSTTLDAQNLGRVLYVTGDEVSPVVEGLRITGGNATDLGGKGGGVYLDAVAATISGCVIYGNTGSTSQGGAGGGLYAYRSPAGGVTRLINNTISGNQADVGGASTGGGVALQHHNSSETSLVGNTIASNVARGSGGGLWVGGGGSVTLENNTIRNNTAGQSYATGGGVYVASSRTTVSGNVFQGNYATHMGGGAQFESAHVTVTHNTFTGNEGRLYGGSALSNRYGAVTLISNTISANIRVVAVRSDFGSATLIDNVISDNACAGVFEFSSATATGNLISNNTGNGMDLQGNPIIVVGNVISGNSKTGVVLYPQSTGTMVVGNLVQNNGDGGIFVSGGSPVLDSNVVVGNRGSSWMGAAAVTIYNASPILRHTTLARNQGPGERAVYAQDSSVSLYNTIIATHTLGVEASGGSVWLDHTLWDAVGAHYSGAVTSTGDISGTAAFSPDGYHLTPASTASDAGVDVGASEDVDGQPRFMGTAPDLGADEIAVYADLSVGKQAIGPGQYGAGEAVVYTLVVTSSPSAEWSTGVQLVDTFDPPAAVAALDASAQGGACQVGARVVTCTLTGVAPGTTQRVTVTATTAGAYYGVLTNTAHVVPTNAVDPELADNVAGPVTVTITYVPPTPDLWVDKAGPAYAQPGETLVYTLTWGNSGALTATAAALSDTLPAGVSYVGASPPPASSPNPLVWNLGDVAPGASGAHRITVTVGSGLPDGAVLTNTAVITGATAEAITANNSDVLTTTVYDTGGVVLEVHKVADTCEAQVGDWIEFTVQMRNASPGAVGAVNTSMSDPIPAGAVYVFGSAGADLGTVQYNPALNRIEWSGALAPDEMANVHFSVEVIACDGLSCGQMRNTAYVQAFGISYTWQASTAVTILCPDLSVEVEAPAYVHFMHPAWYQATVSYANLLPPDVLVTDTPARLTATLPHELIFLWANPPCTLVHDWQCVWDLGLLQQGAGGQIALTVGEEGYFMDGSGYTLQVEIWGDPPDECAVRRGNNQARATTYASEMELEKHNGIVQVLAGPDGSMRWQREFYTQYTYRNAHLAGPPLAALGIVDDWPAELDFGPAPPACYASGCTWGWNPANRQVQVTLPPGLEVDRGGWVRFQGAGDLRTLTPGTLITNTATLQFTIPGSPTFSEIDDAVAEVPLLAPYLTHPAVDGQICPGYVNFKGLAQPGVDVAIKANGQVLVRGPAGANARFDLTAWLGEDPSYTIQAYSVFTNSQGYPVWSEASNQIVVYVDQLPFDPSRSYWRSSEGSYGFYNASGQAAVSGWRAQAREGRNLDLHLWSCGCSQAGETQSFVVEVGDMLDTDLGVGPGWHTFHFAIPEGTVPDIVNATDLPASIKSYCGETTRSGTGWVQVIKRLIDPDGYVFDVTRGFDPQNPTLNALQGVTVTCMVSYPQWGGWVPWPAFMYDQVNPQNTDPSYGDGVTETGYFAFFTPPGHYYLQIEGIPGYQEWRSPVVQVISEVMHVPVPYTPWPETAAVTVTLLDSGPAPAIITVPVGSAVQWRSTISANATITDLITWFENPPLRPLSALDPLANTRGFDGGYLEPGHVYRRQFTWPGLYTYTDGLGHSAQVIVTGQPPYRYVYLPLTLRRWP